jgi:SulP family sulfate permease
MAGCAMIGQSIINVKSGGRGRLSCFVAGVFLLIWWWPSATRRDHPDAGAGGDHDHGVDRHLLWSSINLRVHPRSSSIVMLATVFFVVYTHNLAIGVLVGVLLSGIFFAWKIAQLFKVTRSISPDGRHRTYTVEGQLFFASSEDFMKAFDFKAAPEKVTIDVSRAHIWDISSVAALDMAVLKFRRTGAEVEIIGLNEASETIVDRLAIHDKPGAMDKLLGH